MSEHDFVDVRSRYASIRQRVVGNLDDQAFNGFGIEFSERRMRPSDDAGCHDWSPVFAAHGSVDELTTKFVLDVNPDNVVEGVFGRGEPKLASPVCLEIARPAGNDAHDEGIRLALDP